MPASSGDAQASLTGPQGAKQTGEDEGARYVVQQRISESSPSEPEWRDVATVTVRKGTFTRTVVTAAIKQAGLRPELTDRFRVLDADAMTEYTLTPKEQPQPEYEVSIVVDGERRELPED